MSAVGKKISPEETWNKHAQKLLEGKKIVSVRYMSEKEAEENDLESRPLSFQLDDGTIVIPLSDDEGYNGGSLQLMKKKEFFLLPTI